MATTYFPIMQNYPITIVTLFLIISSVFPLLTDDFTLRAEAAFDDDFIGARARGMGGAFTALSDEADGVFINPAGLSRIATQQLTATMATLYAGLSDESSITQNLVGYAYSNPKKGAMGFAWKRLSVSRLYSENIAAIGLAKQYKFGAEGKTRTLSLGTTIKLLHWGVTPIVGADGNIVEEIKGRTNIGFDIGIIFRPLENAPIAVAIQNINRPNIASKDSNISERLPVNVKLGVAVLGEKVSWAMDLGFKRTQVDVRAGFEWRLYLKSGDFSHKSGDFSHDFLALRLGFRLENLAWGTNITLGAGFKPKKSVRIDYAFLYPVGNIIDTFGCHRMSVVYNF
jgi:hypothetical protein